jgi:hypothetical protein
MPRMSQARKFLIKKARVRSSGYPVGTIAHYGPTDQLATKVVVGIVDSKNEILAMQKWFSTDEDIRQDETIFAEIEAFLREHKVYRVAMVDEIIGCPHEEGIDYPKGESCPQCPYWEGRDRWTKERLD